MDGKVWLLNVWASWCVSCREEHPVLVDFAKTKAGAADRPRLQGQARRRATLAGQRFGNPYDLSVVDADGRVGIDYGVYGVPETYVIDKAGTIRFKQIGPVTRRGAATNKIVPLIKELQK